MREIHHLSFSFWSRCSLPLSRLSIALDELNAKKLAAPIALHPLVSRMKSQIDMAENLAS